MSTQARSRRTEIRTLIAGRAIATQEELRALLADRGHAVTQATLSRDLAQLGARRGPRGYELGALPAPPRLSDLVRSIDDNGSLVVVHTEAGAAEVIAGALDRARLPDVLGTIAGDDAIFIAPARGASAARLARKVRDLLNA